MVPDDLVDDEGQELLGELRIELGFDGQLAQPCDLALFAGRVSRRQLVCCLEPPDPLGVLEPLGEQMDEGGIDVVDARANFLELGVGQRVGFHSRRFYG